MIIEKLTKIDEPKRNLAYVLAVLVVACVSYYTITRNSVAKLQAASAKCAVTRSAYISTESQLADLSNMQKKFEDGKKQLREHEQLLFSAEQAVQFFENINSMALAYNLRPISRIISEPQKLVDDKVDDEKAKLQQQFLKQQSVKISVSGNYYDIADFLNELMNRPQKVCIENLHIALQVGENFNPEVSFRMSLFIDLYERKEQ